MSEATAKTFDELKAEVSAVLSSVSLPHFEFHCCPVVNFVVNRFQTQSNPANLPCRSRGQGLKKEMNAASNLSLELPQKNQSRQVLGDYKNRFEEVIDEFLS